MSEDRGSDPADQERYDVSSPASAPLPERAPVRGGRRRRVRLRHRPQPIDVFSIRDEPLMEPDDLLDEGRQTG